MTALPATINWQTQFGQHGKLHLCGTASPPQTRPVGVLQPEHVSPAVSRLVELIEQAAYDLSTGFMGTALLLLSLTAHGHIRLDWFVQIDNARSYLLREKRSVVPD